MKTVLVRGIFVAMCLAMAASFAVAENWSVDLENKIGGAHYTESFDNVDSKWNAFYYKGILSANYFKEGSIVGRLDFAMPVTSSSEESWNVSGIKYQTNDMMFWGMESNIELGYAFPIVKEKLDLAPIGAYGFSFTRFTRTNFNILNIITSTAIVDEDYWVHHLDIGGKLVYKASDKWTADLKGLYGFVVYDSAHNSEYGTLKGGGGYIIKTELNVAYLFADNLAVSCGAFFDMQHLKGGTSGSIVWPDNDLYTYGGKLDLRYRF